MLKHSAMMLLTIGFFLPFPADARNALILAQGQSCDTVCSKPKLYAVNMGRTGNSRSDGFLCAATIQNGADVGLRGGTADGHVCTVGGGTALLSMSAYFCICLDEPLEVLNK